MPESQEDENLAKLDLMATGDPLMPPATTSGRSLHAANGEVAVSLENGCNGSVNGAHCLTSCRYCDIPHA